MISVNTVLTIICLTLLTWIVDCTTGGLTFSPDKSPLYKQVGQEMYLTCRGIVTKDTIPKNQLEWVRVNGEPLDDIFPTVLRNPDELPNPNEHTLKVSTASLKPEATGQYRCKTQDSDDGTTEIQVIAVTVSTTSQNYTYGETANLGCSVKFHGTVSDNHKKYTLSWSKNNSAVSDGEKFTIHDVNNTLEIEEPKREDIGTYYCKVIFLGGTSFEQIIEVAANFNAAPKMGKVEKSQNRVQGDKLTIHCKVTGYPTPNLIWYKDDEIIEINDNRRLQISDNGDIKNGTLTIYELDFADRGVYMCSSKNALGASNATITVRVKDKLAALWPFLGIVAEVIVLCLIIFIYEKKRSKDSDDEDDTHPEKPVNAEHKGKDDVRQRNVKA